MLFPKYLQMLSKLIVIFDNSHDHKAMSIRLGVPILSAGFLACSMARSCCTCPAV